MVFSGRSVKRMKQNNRAVGTAYEQIAGRFLEKKGFQILEYNYRCRAGEIDLIARDREYLVFCEVKYRRTKVRAVRWKQWIQKSRNDCTDALSNMWRHIKYPMLRQGLM